MLESPSFWFALGSIVVTDLVLSGDNAVVIAMAARRLPPAQRRSAIWLGSAGAVVLRALLTLVTVKLLALPYLKVIGALLLFYIGIKLVGDEDEAGSGHQAPDSLWHALATILGADVVMSLDNVLAVAAAAQAGPEQAQMLLVGIGFALSVPLIIGTSKLVLAAIERMPVIVVAGGALLGYLAGHMLVNDPALSSWLAGQPASLDKLVGAVAAAAVVGIGHWRGRR